MKKVLLAAGFVAALSTAGAASAQVSQRVDINASVATKCGVTAETTTVPIGELTNADAKIRANVTQEIANGLNRAQIIAFCNGDSTVKVERAVLARVGATGNGLADGGFAQFVRYNLDASIDGRLLDTTSDEGSKKVSRFGGHDSKGEPRTHLFFAPAATNGTAVASADGSSPTSTNWSARTDRRLAAGNYVGYVNVTLTPGA